MDSKILTAKVGHLPVYGAVTNIDSADVSTLVSASTKLLKSLAKGTAIVAGVGLAGILLKSLFDSYSEDPAKAILNQNDKLPFDSSPLIAMQGNRAFWGILLDEKLKFRVDHLVGTQPGTQFETPFHYVQDLKWEVQYYNPFHCDVELTLVDGSKYRAIGIEPGTSLNFATILGQQQIEVGWPAVPIKKKHWWSSNSEPVGRPAPMPGWGEYNETYARFVTPEPSNVQQLRNRLKQILSTNRAQIVDQVGSENLKTFFNLDLK